MLELNAISANYSGIQALRDVSLSVRRGEMVALIGPNGAGKSTLLNCISGIVRPTGGSIQFGGRQIARWPAYAVSRSGLLQVPEGRQIIGDLTVLQNLQLGLIAVGKRVSNYSLNEIYLLFPILREREKQRAKSLSGGQQQMLAIARALLGSPALLLLDEPSLGLAPIIVSQVFEVLQKLNRSGLTILLVEQNARLALKVTSRAYVLEGGSVAMSGPSADLAANPRITEHYLGGGR